jgi:hypothetical protein
LPAFVIGSDVEGEEAEEGAGDSESFSYFSTIRVHPDTRAETKSNELDTATASTDGGVPIDGTHVDVDADAGAGAGTDAANESESEQELGKLPLDGSRQTPTPPKPSDAITITSPTTLEPTPWFDRSVSWDDELTVHPPGQQPRHVSSTTVVPEEWNPQKSFVSASNSSSYGGALGHSVLRSIFVDAVDWEEMMQTVVDPAGLHHTYSKTLAVSVMNGSSVYHRVRVAYTQTQAGDNFVVVRALSPPFSYYLLHAMQRETHSLEAP